MPIWRAWLKNLQNSHHHIVKELFMFIVVYYLSYFSHNLFYLILNHILEAARVEQFKDLCKSTVEGAIEHLGNLMRESHESLQKNYECSHDELDRIVKLSDKFGVRARLTGAGLV